jgi:hypothetical protein
MLRIDPAIHNELVEKPGCSSMIMKGKDLNGYVVVGESSLDTKRQLDYWMRLALGYNLKAEKIAQRKMSEQEKNLCLLCLLCTR